MRDKIGFSGATRHRRLLPRAAELMLLVVGCTPLLAAQGGGDPLFPYQWYLLNDGQDVFTEVHGTPGIDLDVLEPLSQGLGGQGVNVMVVDDGVEIQHPDLKDRIDPTMLQNFDPQAPNPNDPTPPTQPPGSIGAGDSHGTAVAGIIAATANNGIGGQGVAPQATLGAARILCGEDCQTEENFLSTYGQAQFSKNVDVFNASYGKDLPFPQQLGISSTMMFKHVEKMREGLGALIAKSAGNEFFQNRFEVYLPGLCANAIKEHVTCFSANNDPEAAVPQVIAVAAVNAMGIRASYSSGGSNILISGLGGEAGVPAGNGYPFPGPGVVTTDLTSCDQGFSSNQALAAFGDNSQLFNVFDLPGSAVNRKLNPDCNYTARFLGTSASAPTVSGVIALLLEANPALTWRDVRTILMETARPIDTARMPSSISLPSGEQYQPEPAWTKNAAGHLFDNWYGFGLIDARTAVDMARQYDTHLTGSMLVNTASKAAPQKGTPIPQGNATGLSVQLPVSGKVQTVEYIQVSINMLSADLSDLAVEVISPAGTRSVLQNAYNGFKNTGKPVKKWLLASNALNGESALGTWTVRFIDVNSRDGKPMRFESVTLRVLGH